MPATLLIALLALLPLALPSPCVPFGLRLNYGRNVYDEGSPERLGVRFNTEQQCGQIELVINKFMIVHCTVQRHSYYMANHNSTKANFTTHIHTCSLTRQLEYDTDLEYNLFNVAEARRVLPSNIKIRIKDPLKPTTPFTFLHIADWGPITKAKEAKRLKDITKQLVSLIQERRIDAVIINGDIGYELNSNAEHHNLTMQLIEKVASRVPMVMNRGNHEVNKDMNSVGSMFNDYFQLYDLEVHNATGVSIGPVFLAIFDPINLLLPRKYHRFTEQSLYSSVTALRATLERARAGPRSIVALSHYPLVCGFPTPGHCIPDQERNEYLPLFVNLKDFTTLMLKYRVPLVLSGHVHTYERSFPFIAGYRSKSRERSNYSFDEQAPFYIQVVEGAAGSNNGVYEKYVHKEKEYSTPAFVASSLLNCTGFGILHATHKELRYEHFAVSKDKRQEKVLTDSFTIRLPHPKNQTKLADPEL